MSSSTALASLADRLGHPFADEALLQRALTHRSWCAEHAGDVSNERLEFLGDAVLGLIVAEHVFRTRPGLSEGWLSRARSSLVRSSTLAAVAGGLGLGEVLRLGRGEEQSGGREKPSLLADALEAVIGAVFVDGGLDPARELVLDLLGDRIDALPDGAGVEADPAVHDHKSRLQELAARELALVPEYTSEESGPEHAKEFTAVVRVGDVVQGSGTGRSKKQAEQAAAAEAHKALLAVHAHQTEGSAALAD